MKRYPLNLLCLFCCLTTSIAGAQTDDDAPASTAGAAPTDAVVWDDLDINDDDSLDGIELKRGAGGWVRYDIDGNGEVSKAEFLVGRFRDGTAVDSPLGTSPAAKTAKPAPAKPKAAPQRINPAPVQNVAAPQAPQAPRAAPIPPVARRAGYIVGRAVFPDGSPVPSFTVDYSGFEKGKLANTYGDGTLIETINDEAKGNGGRYAIKVPPGTYRATAYATYNYRGRTYHFKMELLGTPKYDSPTSGLEELRGGLVRDFVLKMAAKKKGASEESETLYTYAYHGGTVSLDAGQYEGIMGGGNKMSTPLSNAYPPESVILLTLTPTSPLVDGTMGQPIQAQFPLGDAGKWTFMVRGVHPGVYSASAKLRLPDGGVKALRLSNRDAQTDVANSRIIFERQSTATVDFLPSEIGVAPRKGVKTVTLYLGD